MSLAVFLVLNFIAAASGGIFTPGQWYEELRKPSWQPPNWAFPVVWSVLYLLNAIAGWMVWNSVAPASAINVAIGVYVVSLVLNAAWSWLFFGLKKMQLALWEAILLWLSVAIQIYLFMQIDLTAGLILIPYLAWVTIAVVLNRTMINLNPEFG